MKEEHVKKLAESARQLSDVIAQGGVSGPLFAALAESHARLCELLRDGAIDGQRFRSFDSDVGRRDPPPKDEPPPRDASRSG